MRSKKSNERVSEADPLERLKAAQAWVRAKVPEGVFLSDELIADRREEARRELGNESR